jgi:hypothetical protein
MATAELVIKKKCMPGKMTIKKSYAYSYKLENKRARQDQEPT